MEVRCTGMWLGCGSKCEKRSQGLKKWNCRASEWILGVDYALLGERGELLENPYHYRDRRTEGVMEEVFSRVGKEEIYQATAFSSCPSTLCISYSPRGVRAPRFLAQRNSWSQFQIYSTTG